MIDLSHVSFVVVPRRSSGRGRDGGADASQEAREDGSAADGDGDVDHSDVWCGGEPVDGGGEYGAWPPP
jgi:hypothetical protein